MVYRILTDDKEWVKVPSSKPDGSLAIGGIAVNVSQGDITQSKDDCIINSSNEDLDLSRGKTFAEAEGIHASPF